MNMHSCFSQLYGFCPTFGVNQLEIRLLAVIHYIIKITTACCTENKILPLFSNLLLQLSDVGIG